MDSILPNTSVSISGAVANRHTLISLLSSKHIRVINWSPRISALVCGDDAETHWKYAAASQLGIRLLKAQDLMPPVANELWADLYKPKRVSEIIGHLEQIKTLAAWLKGFATAEKHGALITGPPGIGKTTVAHLVVKACGYDVIELNASDERSASAVRRWFEEAAGSHHVGKQRVVIMDEVDGMSRGDRGGIGELARVIKVCKFPIVCIANERASSSPRMRPLASACIDIRFQRPVRSTIAKRLMETVVAKQRLTIKMNDLEDLCEQNGNDIRQILNFLQYTCGSRDLGSTKDELLRVDAFSAAGKVFQRHLPLEMRSNLVFTDFGMVPLMVCEGYIAAAAKGGGDDTAALSRCVRSGDHISMWNMLDNRIHKSQAWGLMPSAVISVVAAAAAAMGPAPFQLFPQWLGKMSKRSKHGRWFQGMRQRCGITSAEAMLDMRSTMRARLFRGELGAPAIVNTLIDLRLTRDDMMEALVDTAFDTADVMLDSKLKGAISREYKKRGLDESVEKIVKKVGGNDGDDDEDDAGSDSDNDDVDMII